MKNDINIDVLAEQFHAAKLAEDAAIAHRRSIGKLIEDALPGADEGTTSAKVGNLKITVTRKVTRKVDSTALQNKWEFLPGNVRDTFKWTADINTRHYRALQELATAELNVANEFITTTPAATSVKVEPIETKE